jgi:TPR repeat protein
LRGGRGFVWEGSVTNDRERAWVTAAESGDSEAIHRLGVRFWQRGREFEAETWWRRAAEAGQVAAMNHLALLLARDNRRVRILRGLVAETRWQRAADAVIFGR